MSMQEMWQWVHACYGQELGLTSEDEDYIEPLPMVEGNSRLSMESFSEVCHFDFFLSILLSKF